MSAVTAEGFDPRQDAERIEHLLVELQAMAGPSTWQWIEELMERLLRTYGAGLERTLGHARAAGADAARFDGMLAGDELVASLLLLHGLHPLPTRVRVERALEKVRPLLGSHAGGVDLVDLSESGRVLLRLTGSCDGCPSSRATVESSVRRAIEEAAPEILGIDVEGDAPPARKIALPQIGARGGDPR